KVFAKVHPRFRTPHISTIITGVFVGVTALFTSLDDMVDLTNIGTLFAFFLVCIGIIILRVKDPDRERGFRVPGGAWFLPLLGAVSCLVLAKFLPWKSWYRFGGWLCLGLVVYFSYGWSHSHLRKKLAVALAGHDFDPRSDFPDDELK
ncbi:MAG TPA: amino acid permease, partial [Thermoanaerobaculia bacterium]|nr:amino acid permease [Thermoanaerobaculia bacterium]